MGKEKKVQKLWDRDAHLMTDDKLTVTEEKAVDFEDGHSLDIGVDGLDDSLTTAMDIHSEGHGAMKTLDNIAKTMRKLRKS